MARNGREVGMVVRRVRLEIAQVVGLRLSGLASGGDCWGDVTRPGGGLGIFDFCIFITLATIMLHRKL